MIKAIKPSLTDTSMKFTDGSELSYSHDQDCCEENYLDWSSLDDTGFYEKEFERIGIETWEYGIKINGYSINAYSDQNGYYSNDVDVTYVDKNGEEISFSIFGLERD